MNKFLKKLALISMSAIMAFSFTACGGGGGTGGGGTGGGTGGGGTGGGGKPTDEETTLNIYALHAGYGSEFIDAYAKMFEQQNPGVKVVWKSSTEAFTKIYEDLRLGPKRNPYDLYLAPDAGWQMSIQKDHISGYDCILEDLSDLYDTQIPGEEVTISQKLYNGFETFSTFKGKQYVIPWAGGPTGLVYNANVIAEKDLPRTTNQLMKALKKTYGKSANGKEITAFMTSEKGAGYFEYLGDTWWAQYEGVENYMKFYTLDKDPRTGKGAVSDKHMDDFGFRRNFELIEEMLGKETTMYPNCRGLEHTQSQQYFLFGYSAFMPCGNWLQAEMNKNFDEKNMNFKMMRTPIISDIAKVPQLNFPGATDDEKDANLAALIDYIDNGEQEAEKPAWATSTQIQVVKNARNVIYDAGISHPAFIPSYSNAKGLAKKFLLMMATDEAIKTYIDIVHTTTAYKYDYKSVEGSSLYKSYADILTDDSFHIASWANAIPERITHSLKKFNAHIHSYADMQNGELTAKKLADDEIKTAKERISKM